METVITVILIGLYINVILNGWPKINIHKHYHCSCNGHCNYKKEQK